MTEPRWTLPQEPRLRDDSTWEELVCDSLFDFLARHLPDMHDATLDVAWLLTGDDAIHPSLTVNWCDGPSLQRVADLLDVTGLDPQGCTGQFDAYGFTADLTLDRDLSPTALLAGSDHLDLDRDLRWTLALTWDAAPLPADLVTAWAAQYELMDTADKACVDGPLWDNTLDEVVARHRPRVRALRTAAA